MSTTQRGPRTKRGPGWRIETDRYTGKVGCKHLHISIPPRVLTPEGMRAVWVTTLWTVRHEKWWQFLVEADFIDAEGISMPCAELLAQRLMPLVQQHSIEGSGYWDTFHASQDAGRALAARMRAHAARVRERRRVRAFKEKLRTGTWSRVDRLIAEHRP